MVTSRIWFTAAQKAELWERWKNGQASGEPRMLQGRNGCTQRLKVVFLHFYLGIFQG